MKTDPEILKLKAKLEKVKAPDDWSEITGPFFHLKLPDTPASGPYMAGGLKVLAEEQAFPVGTVIRDAKNIGDWISVYAHPAFQRRKPQIVGEDENIPHDMMAYILVDGQKHGPLATGEIKTLLKQKEIILTDQVSFDEGHTWRKLYEYQEFDRRDLEQGHLPSIPGWDVFKGSNEEISDQLDHAEERERQLNAFAGLAFLENVQAGRSHDHSDDPLEQHEIEEHEAELTHSHDKGADIVEFRARTPQTEISSDQDPNSRKKNFAYVVAICFMLGASSYMLFSDPMSSVNLKSARNQASKKLIKRGTPTKGRTPEAQKEMVRKAQDQEQEYTASRVNRIRKAPSRRPASITDTDSFQEQRQMQDRPFRDNEDPYQDGPYDDYAYDDGSTPVAQDRVRKRLDKRTIDSENQYYDEGQMEEFAESDIDSVEGVWGEGAERMPANTEDAAYNDQYDGGDGYAEDSPQQEIEPAYEREESTYEEAPMPQENYPDDGAQQEYREEYREELNEEYREEYTQEPMQQEDFSDDQGAMDGY